MAKCQRMLLFLHISLCELRIRDLEVERDSVIAFCSLFIDHVGHFKY